MNGPRGLTAPPLPGRLTEDVEGRLHVVGLQHGDGEVERVRAGGHDLLLAGAEAGNGLSAGGLAVGELRAGGGRSGDQAGGEEEGSDGGGLHFDLLEIERIIAGNRFRKMKKFSYETDRVRMLSC